MTNKPYAECNKCVATSWCKKYSGEVKVTNGVEWCSAKFRLDKAMQLACIPKIYRKANMSTYVVDEHNSENWQDLKELLDDIVEVVEEGSNFFMYGTVPGTGKTFTSCCILNEYIRKTCLTDKFDFEHPLALYVTYADVMDALRYRRDEVETFQLIESMKEVPLLLLDDVGSGTTSPFTVEQTYMLLNHRFNNGLSTIVTSNLSLKQLKEPTVLGERSVSRILSNCTGYSFTGTDKRRTMRATRG